MDFGRFVDEHRASWRQLELLLDRIDSRGLKALSADEVRDLARLYRKASADLLLARDLDTRADVTDYLEAIVGRAYTAIYSARRLRWGRVLGWFVRGWPRAMRREKRYVQLAAATFAVGMLTSFVLTLADPEAFDYLVPAQFASFYAEEPENYRDARFGEMADSEAARFSSELMTNNIRVALNSFALGLTLGVGTLAMLFFNGILIGSLAANFLTWGQSVEFWALVLPHGVIEIFSICLGGGAGLILADAILRPGRRRRIDALRERAIDAVGLLGMAVPLLILAGVIEGYVTPLSILPDWGKLAFAALTAVGLGTYIAAPWLRGEDPARAEGPAGASTRAPHPG
jgi:uncharacterized membrane protein SpoIIM required for sporulation